RDRRQAERSGQDGNGTEEEPGPRATRQGVVVALLEDSARRASNARAGRGAIATSRSVGARRQVSRSAATTLLPSAARMLNVRHAARVSITSKPTRASVNARVSIGCGKRIVGPEPNSTTSGL